MSSLHIEAESDQIAETILLPGDPLRAKFVADNMLEDAFCYNKVRNMLGFTGIYKGKKVSVQGTGMGMGSASIYINELITTYNVKQLIRVSASGDSGANQVYFEGMHYAATADFDLLFKAYEAAQRLNIQTQQGSVFSTNTFYDDDPQRWDKWERHGILGIEMESQILFTLASRFNVKALSILTVSDHIKTGEASSHTQREKSYVDMMKIALELA